MFWIVYIQFGLLQIITIIACQVAYLSLIHICIASEDREFVVPAKLKELILNKDFGRYAMADGTMPRCV